MQNLVEIQRSRIPHHLSQHWRDLHRQGTARSGSQCQPTAILNVQAVRFGGAEVYQHQPILSRSISENTKGNFEDVLVKVDNFYYPMDFVVLDTEPMAESTHQVPIILGRPFLAIANAIINCRNGVMQLTFGNMTLELNIFHLSNKDKPAEDKGQKSEEVCLSGIGEGKHSVHVQEELIESQEAVDEGSTASVILPASIMQPAPPESIILNNQKQKLYSTATHLTASIEELLLLNSP